MIADVADSELINGALGILSIKKAERLIRHPAFAESVRQFVASQIAELSVRKFQNEEVESNYGYLCGYRKPRGIVEQTNLLRQVLPGLGFVNTDLLKQIQNGEIKLPEHAEGWFAIPNWRKNPDLFGETYGEAIQKVLDVLKRANGGMVANYREGQLGSEYVRQSARSEAFWEKLSEEQGNPDILIIAGQFGILHRGRSIRCALEFMIETPGGEVGLGAFAVGIMLLTHPERLQNYDDLWIDCAGDEYAPGADGGFSDSLYFSFVGGEVGFNWRYLGNAREYYGTVSAFPPQK